MALKSVRWSRRLPLLALAPFVAGCYTFAPARVEDARPDQSVRVRLAPVEAARLADFADPTSRTVEGRMVEATADSVLLLVPSHSEVRGTRVETLFQRVQVGREGVLELELKSLDRPRTYLVSGLVFAGITAFVVNRLAGGGGSEVVPPGGGPADAVIPALRIPFGLGWLPGR